MKANDLSESVAKEIPPLEVGRSWTTLAKEVKHLKARHFRSREDLVDAVRIICELEFEERHGFPWPWRGQPPERVGEERAELPPQEFVVLHAGSDAPETLRRQQLCLRQLEELRREAATLAEGSKSPRARTLGRVARALAKLPLRESMGKPVRGRALVAGTANSIAWATGVPVRRPRDVAVVSLLLGEWPAGVKPSRYTPTDVVIAETRAIREALKRNPASRPIARTVTLADLLSPITSEAFGLKVTLANVMSAVLWRVVRALSRTDPQLARGLRSRAPPGDLGSLLATREHQRAAVADPEFAVLAELLDSEDRDVSDTR